MKRVIRSSVQAASYIKSRPRSYTPEDTVHLLSEIKELKG